MSFVPVARSEEVHAPKFLRREVDSRPILLTRLSDGTAVAFGNICPHQNRELDEGTLWEDEIDCPHHHYTYDPRTGENRFPKRVFPARRAATVAGIPTFETQERSGWVWVGPRSDKQARDERANEQANDEQANMEASMEASAGRDPEPPRNARNHRIESLRSELSELQTRIAEAQDEQRDMLMELSELLEEKRRIARRKRQQKRTVRRRGPEGRSSSGPAGEQPS
jgi:nitrite reductase/ring-hydroxylating ferredoxin subunit